MIGAEISLINEMAFPFPSRDLSFWQTICAISTKYCQSSFLLLEWKFRHVTAGFALLTVVETRNYSGFNVNNFFFLTFWTIHISSYFLIFGIRCTLNIWFLLYLAAWIRSILNSCSSINTFEFFRQLKMDSGALVMH